MRSIGIDIGSYSIKVAELEYSAKEVRLTGYVEYPLPISTSTDNYVNVIEKLKSIVDKYDRDLDRFVVGLPQDMVCNRFVSFPFKEKYKIAKTIGFELDDDLPFDTEECIIHPKITHTIGENHSHVLAFAALKENIKKHLELFQDVGIEPDILSSNGSALSNYFENWREAPPNYSQDEVLPAEASAVLHLGHKKSVLAIERGGVLISLRSIHFGGHDVAKNIMEKYNVSHADAMKSLEEKAFILLSQKKATQEQIAFSTVISTSIDTLASEVKRHMISIEAQMQIRIEEVFISGGLSGIQNLSPYLTQALHVSTNPYSKDFRELPMLEDIPPKQRGSAIIALGLAIEGVKSIKSPAVNFRKDEFEKKSQTFQLFISKWGETLKTLGVLFLILCGYAFTSSIITERISDQSGDQLKELANSIGLRGRQATRRQIGNYIKEKRKEIETKKVVSKLQNINSPLDILLKTSKSTPNKNAITLDIKKWQLRGDDLQIEGYVENSRQLRLIKNAYENLAINNKVEVNPVRERKAGKAAFSYSLETSRNQGVL